MKEDATIKLGGFYFKTDAVTSAEVSVNGVLLHFGNGSNKLFTGDDAALLTELLNEDAVDIAAEAAAAKEKEAADAAKHAKHPHAKAEVSK